MKNINILGCGWLGLPVAKQLQANGYCVKGSTTTSEKISLLESKGITGFKVVVSENGMEGNIDLFLENSEILIIDFPPKLRGENSENYVSKIKNLIPYIEKSSVTKVLFVGSTSVYSDDKSLLNIDETTKPFPDSESGKQLLEAENHLRGSSSFETTILRFGGLIGDDRHPIKFLAGRKNIENPKGPINLIHQKDCIRIIEKIVQQAPNANWNWNETFHAVFPYHPTRKEYYTQKATELCMPLPEFDEAKTSFGKIISSSKLETILPYKFQEKP